MKVYIKRKRLNEDISINDPGLAQQYLAVKKQITDKNTKRNQLMRSVNQIDSEIDILNKNLIVIETKAAQKQGEVQISSTQNKEKQTSGEGGEGNE